MIFCGAYIVKVSCLEKHEHAHELYPSEWGEQPLCTMRHGNDTTSHFLRAETNTQKMKIR